MIKLDENACDMCGTCISVCPVNALTLNELLSINHCVCIECGNCVKVCPFGAISQE